MLFSTAGTAGKARLTIAPDGPPGEGSGLQEHIRGETGGRRGPAGRHRAASGGPRRGSGRGRRQGEPEWQAVSPTACRSGPPGPGLPMKKERLVLQQTSNYQLNQWDAEDRIQREDFNGDNSKIDAALAGEKAARETAVTALTAAVAKCGNCRIVYGSYGGNDQYGSSNQNTLTFDGTPLFIVLSGRYHFYSVKGSQYAQTICSTSLSPTTLFMTWDSQSVSWYTSESADKQLNLSDETYFYIALLAVN